MKSEFKTGFTLVELSIVLVIIGLLIGGILIGQSMIDSAKVSAQVQQIQQFDAAITAFKGKYKFLPGDAPAFGGNGNMIVENQITTFLNKAEIFTCETANFWNSIFPSQYSSTACNVTSKAALTSGATKNIPEAKFGKAKSKVLVSPFATACNNSNVTDVFAHNYIIIDSSQLPAGTSLAPSTSTNSAVTPAELLALDQKLDDGVANDGYVRSAKIGNRGGNTGAPCDLGLPTCSTTTQYLVQNAGYECTPAIRLGGSGGNPM